MTACGIHEKFTNKRPGSKYKCSSDFGGLQSYRIKMHIPGSSSSISDSVGLGWVLKPGFLTDSWFWLMLML